MKILYVSPSSTDPLAFYRGAGPLRRMRQQFKDFDYIDQKQVDSAVPGQADLVFLQRPFEANHLQVALLAKKNSYPIVADFDDWFMGLHPSNPACPVFKKNEANFLQIVNTVDAITVSTEHLKNLILNILENRDKPIYVVPNAYDPMLFCHYRDNQNIPPRKKIVLWRGGSSHNHDLAMVKDDYQRLVTEFEDWQFLFIGAHPWILGLENKKNVQFLGGYGILDFFEQMYKLAPAITAHPLCDYDFNKAKSMCSWLEATHAFSAFVGPKFQEFDRPGITQYQEKPYGFYESVSKLMKAPQKIVEKVMASNQYIKENLTVFEANKLRLKAFKETLEPFTKLLHQVQSK